MKFWLGVHLPNWAEKTDVPLFISRRRLQGRKRLPQPVGEWALDSGGFSELSLNGRWDIDDAAYAVMVRRFADEMPGLEWAAPLDWMCEPHVIERTGRTVAEHQRLTIDSVQRLWDLGLHGLVVPVLQGWLEHEYLNHAEMYDRAGIDLAAEDVVAIGSVCRRDTVAARRVLRRLHDAGIRQIHAFGVKGDALVSLSDVIASADSMAWSYRARRSQPLPGCTHKSCSNCLRFALRWRERLVGRLDQLRLEVPCSA